MLQEVSDVVKQRPLVVLADARKLAEELAALLDWRGPPAALLVAERVRQPLSASDGQEPVVGPAPCADTEVGTHEPQDGGVNSERAQEVRVAVEQVAVQDGPVGGGGGGRLYT